MKDPTEMNTNYLLFWWDGQTAPVFSELDPFRAAFCLRSDLQQPDITSTHHIEARRMRNGQQSVSTRSSGVHRPLELRKRNSESGGGKKKHARGEGGVPVSRPSSATTTTTKKKRTNKHSSNDMDNYTKRSYHVEDETDDDDISTSSPPPQTKTNKKRKVSMPIDLLAYEEAEEEEQSGDESQETAEAETPNDCFRRQENKGPPTCPTPNHQQIRDRSPNPPNQMDDTTTLLHAELRRLQEENNKMKSQLSATRQEAVQTARVTPAKNINQGSEGFAALNRMDNTLLVAVRNFATKFVFPKAKFLQTELMAQQYCMLAVANNDVALPMSATVEQFAAKVRQIRLNSNTGARVKFIADLKQGKVPEGFSYETLKDGYRNYKIDEYDSEEKREKKKAGLVAFQYFVDRILASVNADRTRFGPEKHKNRVGLLLSDAFTVSDEAYALYMLENYETRWRLQSQHPNDKNKWRQDEDFQAKFTSSNNGLNHKLSISNAIKSFNEKCEFVAEKRSVAETGILLEQMLKEQYILGSDGNAMQADKPDKISKQQGDDGDASREYVVQAYMDFDLSKALEGTAAV
eukprot:scaffold3068_cov133-Cylindrotheca_fusiformis.AAC.1